MQIKCSQISLLRRTLQRSSSLLLFFSTPLFNQPPRSPVPPPTASPPPSSTSSSQRQVHREREREREMATSPSVPAAGASVMASSASSSSSSPLRRPHAKAVFFRLVPKPRLHLLSTKVSRLNFGPRRACVVVARAHPNEVNAGRHDHYGQVLKNATSVALSVLVLLYQGIFLMCSKVVGGHSNDAVAVEGKPDSPKVGDAQPPAKEAQSSPMSVETVSEFMTQVASLVKLVDSRDIIELQLKQQDCELLIRKKEALPQPPAPAPIVMMQPQHGPPPVMQSQPIALPSAPPAPASASALPAAPPSPATAAKSAKPSLPPLKSPMAGTFYGSPGPGQPPFVKVGDKVNKGQVLCIIEAMKLMNEIEADQAGTILEILVDDAKPVSIDQPLFVIES